MRRAMQLCIACALLLVYQCAAQGGGGVTKAKSTYAHPRDFGQWAHALHKDPLVLVAFITAVLSVPGFLLIMWPLVYDYIYAAAVSFKLCSKRPLSMTLERSSSEFFIRSSKQ